MKRTFRSPLLSSLLASIVLAMISATALAQSPMFPNVRPVQPYGSGIYANFYGPGTGGVLPGGAGLGLKPLPPAYRQPLPAPRGPFYWPYHNTPAPGTYGNPYVPGNGGPGLRTGASY